MRCSCTHCVYCGQPLAGKHEHDHMPIPFRAGGDDTVPACLNCHSLKDRKPWVEWDTTSAIQAYSDLPPLGRVLLAQLIANWHVEGFCDHRLRVLQSDIEDALKANDLDRVRSALAASQPRPRSERSKATLWGERYAA
jgi:hypothetical protein